MSSGSIFICATCRAEGRDPHVKLPVVKAEALNEIREAALSLVNELKWMQGQRHAHMAQIFQPSTEVGKSFKTLESLVSEK